MAALLPLPRNTQFSIWGRVLSSSLDCPLEGGHMLKIGSGEQRGFSKW
uniref:Uncharacterized protein n=1 Tax=Anguilla anguilla TaxID=7936 RepID=A0A0E9Q6F9_ANGAN